MAMLTIGLFLVLIAGASQLRLAQEHGRAHATASELTVETILPVGESTFQIVSGDRLAIRLKSGR